MRKLLVPAVAATILATGSVAFAATMHNASGTVKSFDAKAMRLTLMNGGEYMLPRTFKDPGLRAGTKVNIAWETGKSGGKVAESVTIAK
jgi:hypothetical protein